MRTRTRLAALLLAGLALCVGPPLASAHPKGGIDIPAPDLDVSVAANGGVRISNVGDQGTLTGSSTAVASSTFLGRDRHDRGTWIWLSFQEEVL